MKTQKLFFIGLFVLMGSIVMAQREKNMVDINSIKDCPCSLSNPIPYMFIATSEEKKRDNQCKQRRHLVTQENPMYPVQKFIDLLKFITNTSTILTTINNNNVSTTTTSNITFDGLRIYFAAVNETELFDDKFRLIFVPTTTDATGNKYTDSEFYFLWENECFKRILVKDALLYIRNYQNSLKANVLDKMKYGGFLNSGIGGHPLPTATSVNKGDAGDTRSMLYNNIGELIELQNEFDICQQGIIKMVRIDISSYGHKKVIGDPDFHPEFMDRLILHFKMFRLKKRSQTKYEVYSLEDNKACYKARLQNKKHPLPISYDPNFDKKHKLFGGEAGFDTGTPCPPGDSGGGCPTSVSAKQ